ncbi:MAG: hypothetical protein ACOYI8_01640 [Christensenellales bacterium]|jgi:hypothetical protein
MKRMLAALTAILLLASLPVSGASAPECLDEDGMTAAACNIMADAPENANLSATESDFEGAWICENETLTLENGAYTVNGEERGAYSYEGGRILAGEDTFFLTQDGLLLWGDRTYARAPEVDFTGEWSLRYIEAGGARYTASFVGVEGALDVKNDTYVATVSGEEFSGDAAELSKDGALAALIRGEVRLLFARAEAEVPPPAAVMPIPQPAPTEEPQEDVAEYEGEVDFRGVWRLTAIEGKGALFAASAIGFEKTVTVYGDVCETLSNGEAVEEACTIEGNALTVGETVYTMTAEDAMEAEREDMRMLFVRESGLPIEEADFEGTWVLTSITVSGSEVASSALGFHKTIQIASGAVEITSNGETRRYAAEFADGVLTFEETGTHLMLEGGFLWESGEMPMKYARAEEEPDPMAPFVGTWHAVYLSTGGASGDPRAMWNLDIALILNADGTGTGDYIGMEDKTWGYDEEAGAVFYGSGTPLMMLEGGILMYGTEESGYILFSRDEDASYMPEEPDVLEEPEAPEVPAPENADDSYIGIKFVCVGAEADGYAIETSLLGGEYSVVFKENGKADFVMAGAEMADMFAYEERDGNIVMDMNGNDLVFEPTETGFRLNYFDSMLMFFEAE